MTKYKIVLHDELLGDDYREFGVFSSRLQAKSQAQRMGDGVEKAWRYHYLVLPVEKNEITKDGHFWQCDCGNNTDSGGFVPINSKGEEVEPTVKEWDTDLYKCIDCGTTIHV